MLHALSLSWFDRDKDRIHHRVSVKTQNPTKGVLIRRRTLLRPFPVAFISANKNSFTQALHASKHMFADMI